MSDAEIALRTMFLVDGMSMNEISEKTGIPIEIVKTKLNKYAGVAKSKGSESLLDVLMEIYPNFIIEREWRIGRQFIDFYIPKLRLGFEFDGIQHFHTNTLYHRQGLSGSQDLMNQQEADGFKEKSCNENFIYLIRISYKDEISISNIRRKIDEHTSGIVANLELYSNKNQLWI